MNIMFFSFSLLWGLGPALPLPSRPHKEASDLMKDDLRKKLDEAITWSTTHSIKVKFGSHGQFRDKQFLEDKYKHVPEQLAELYRNARTCFHPDRKCQMWEDRELSLALEDEEVRTEERKRKMETTEAIKRVPKVKEASMNKKPRLVMPLETGGEVEEQKTPVALAHLKKLDGFMKKSGSLQLELATVLTEATSPDLTAMIPSFQIKKATNASDQMQMCNDIIRSVVNTKEGKKTTVQELLKAMPGDIKEAQSLCEKLKSMVHDANEQLAAVAAECGM
jgi:hypothetical protein